MKRAEIELDGINYTVEYNLDGESLEIEKVLFQSTDVITILDLYNKIPYIEDKVAEKIEEEQAWNY